MQSQYIFPKTESEIPHLCAEVNFRIDFFLNELQKFADAQQVVDHIEASFVKRTKLTRAIKLEREEKIPNQEYIAQLEIKINNETVKKSESSKYNFLSLYLKSLLNIRFELIEKFNSLLNILALRKKQLIYFNLDKMINPLLEKLFEVSDYRNFMFKWKDIKEQSVTTLFIPDFLIAIKKNIPVLQQLKKDFNSIIDSYNAENTLSANENKAESSEKNPVSNISKNPQKFSLVKKLFCCSAQNKIYPISNQNIKAKQNNYIPRNT